MNHDTTNHKKTMVLTETGIGRDRVQTLEDKDRNITFVRTGYGSWEKKEKKEK